MCGIMELYILIHWSFCQFVHMYVYHNNNYSFSVHFHIWQCKSSYFFLVWSSLFSSAYSTGLLRRKSLKGQLIASVWSFPHILVKLRVLLKRSKLCFTVENHRNSHTYTPACGHMCAHARAHTRTVPPIPEYIAGSCVWVHRWAVIVHSVWFFPDTLGSSYLEMRLQDCHL